MVDAAVAKKIGVPFRTLNLMNFYHHHVVNPMVQGYANGITPNPDVLCNRRFIKIEKRHHYRHVTWLGPPAACLLNEAYIIQ